MHRNEECSRDSRKTKGSWIISAWILRAEFSQLRLVSSYRNEHRPIFSSAQSGGTLFYQCHDIARTGHTLGPRPVEISDHFLEFVGDERGVEQRLVGKLIDSVVHALLRLTPEAPRPLAFEYPHGPRQMVGRVPMIEFCSQRCSDDRTDHKQRLGHR